MIIADEASKDKVLKALSDEYSRSILLSTIESSKSATELSDAGKIPISTTYRRIHELQEAGLIAVARSVVTEDGKRYDLYRGMVKDIRIIFGSNSVEVDLVPNEDMVGKFVRLWNYVRAK